MKARHRLALALLLLAAPPAAGARADNSAALLQPPAPAFVEPPVWPSRNHILSGTLLIGRTQNRLGNRIIDTLTYNGGIPGPTWLVEPGDEIKVRLVNDATQSETAATLAQLCPPASGRDTARALLGVGGIVMAEDPIALHTNIHTHGLQVDPRGNSDNVYVDIAPGQYFDYRIKIPKDQPAGLYFYHPHRHMAASRQLWNGMAGAIVVKGGLDNVPAVKAVKDRLLVVNELILDGFGQVPAATLVPTAGPVPFYGLPPVPTEILFPVNGVLQPRITMRPGEIQRWRVVNAAAHRFLDLAIEGSGAAARRMPLHQIAQDGINFGVSVDHDNILMAPANRVEFMVQIKSPGTYYLKALPFNQGHPGGARPERILAEIVVAGAPAHPATTFPLKLIPPQEDALVQRKPGPEPAEVEWSGQIEVKPVSFFLDGKQFDPTQPRPANRNVSIGATEVWTLKNHDVFRHPFHIHVNPFQVIEINGRPTPLPRPWWDTFILPAKGTVKLFMTFRPDKAGKTVYHCHIIPHEDAGMMAVLNLRSPKIPFTVPPVGPFACKDTPGACPPFRPAPPVFTAIGRRYVFTQLANQSGPTSPIPAPIGLGGIIRLQLPGDANPDGTLWTVSVKGNAIHSTGFTFIPSVGQFAGADGIYEFRFDAVREGSVTIHATTKKPFPWDPAHGDFVLALDVMPANTLAARQGGGIFPTIVDPLAHKGALIAGDRPALDGMSVTVSRSSAPKSAAITAPEAP